MKAYRYLILVLLGCSFGVHAEAGNVEKGKALAENCVTCHNLDGNSVNAQWPKIAGQHEKYLVKQLMDIQKGPESGRSNPLMMQLNEKLNIKDLSEQDIKDLSAYYAQQVQTDGDAFSDTAALGERIFKGGNPKSGVAACMSCHSSSGAGNGLANYPRLAGQHAEYTYTQLKNFQSGQRANDASAIMRSIAKRMTDEEMKAVSNYIQGMRLVEAKDVEAKTEEKPEATTEEKQAQTKEAPADSQTESKAVEKKADVKKTQDSKGTDKAPEAKIEVKEVSKEESKIEPKEEEVKDDKTTQ